MSKGTIKKITHTNFGTQHVLYSCKETESFGYHAILSEELYQNSAIVLLDSAIDFIVIQDFINAVNCSHALTLRLLKDSSHEFRVFINATKMLAKHTVRERAALNLLILESKFQVNEGVENEMIINRGDLASMVGTAQESLVRVLKGFKEPQLITTKRSRIFSID